MWDGGFTPGSQIRLSVPEPRGNAEIADNYAVLVDAVLDQHRRTTGHRVDDRLDGVVVRLQGDLTAALGVFHDLCGFPSSPCRCIGSDYHCKREL